MSTHLPLAELIGRSPALDALREQIRRLARISEGGRLPSILLLGETGTGKGLVAGLLHRTGLRGAGPFVDVNCAAIPETLLEAELFGFERGAFTDARAAKRGLIEAANHGTLFLDEIGSLPDALQAKLLTAIESRQVRRIGSTRNESMDVWIVAATSEDLTAAMQTGRFRPELYHRLSTVVLQLPPLRARGRDILILADHFLARAAAEHGIAPKRLAEDAQAALLAHRWPGNVRELGNVIERVMLLEDSPLITAAMLSLARSGADLGYEPASGLLRSRMTRRADQRQHLMAALDAAEGNVARAAARLGIPRNTLRYRLAKHDLIPRASESVDRVESGDAGTTAAPFRSVATPATAIRWEERLVAVLGAMVMSPAGGSFEPASVMPELIEKIAGFGARIEEFTPSGLTAVFGIDPMEDAARRAVLAAQAMLQALRRVDGTKYGRFAVHLGAYLIARAGAVTGMDARARRQATDIINTLLHEAGPDQVVVDAAAARFLERHFAMEAIGEGPTAPYRVVGRESPGFEAGRRALSRFVGRTRDLDTLRELMAKVEAGEAQILGLVGEPGVGKSRLVFELTHSHRVAEWLVLEARFMSYGKATSYLPMADLLRGYFRISDRDTLRDIREKVTGKILTLDRGLEPTLPALFALLEVAVDDPRWQSLDPAQRRRQTFEAVRRLLLRETQVQPLLVVLEDLQWIDTETQEFLDSLVESLPRARLLLLASYRPDYRHGWVNKTSYSQLRLDALPPESAGELLNALLGSDPGLEPLKRLLVKRGNPLFIEESIRTLVETGALTGERGAHRLTRAIQAIEVPATVQVILAARIDRLPASDKQLLQTASVIGKDVPFVLLHAVVEGAEDAVHHGLAHLQTAEFLYETRLSPDREYTFKHALTHEVTYGTLLQDRRKTLHARIVGAIERCYPDRLTEHVERLAHHAARGEMWEPAVTYLHQAGAKALARSANREAVSYFEQALTALQHLPETRARREQAIDLRFDLRTALFPLGEFVRIFGCLREAEGLARALDDQRRLGQLSVYMCHNLNMTGHPTEALRFGRRAQAIAESLGDVPLQVTGNLYLGGACLRTGDYRRAEELLLKVLQLLDGERSRERFGLAGFPAVMARFYLDCVLADQGKFAEGIIHGQEGIRLAEALDHPYSLTVMCSALGYVHIARGDLDRAIRPLERGVALGREWNLTFHWAQNAGILGYAYALAGRSAEGIPLLEHALSALETMGVGAYQPSFLAYLGEAYVLAGRLEDALEPTSRALTLAREGSQRGYEARALQLLGEISARRDLPEHANDCYREALALAVELEMRPLVAHCHLGLGKLSARLGKPDPAREHLTTAAMMYLDMEMRFWLEQAEAEMRELA
jgi:DNA-binding NtrC family response regulator/tetratricopeptide (TPR) repeat protein